MKIAAISDIHGHLPEIPKADILLLAGDICCHGNVNRQLDWLDTSFRRWLEGLDMPVALVAGNHDWPFEKRVDEVRNLKLPCHYLQDSGVEFQGLRIYGTPWQKRFYDWAFNLDLPQLKAKFDLIPEDTDILITHEAPFGYGDSVAVFGPQGSPALLAAIMRIRPKIHVFGHIHEGHGLYNYEEMKIANVSHVDKKYRPAFEATIFEI